MTTNDKTGIYHERLSAATAPLIGSIISQCFSEGRGRESRVEKGKGNQEMGSRHNSPPRLLFRNSRSEALTTKQQHERPCSI